MGSADDKPREEERGREAAASHPLPGASRANWALRELQLACQSTAEALLRARSTRQSLRERLAKGASFHAIAKATERAGDLAGRRGLAREPGVAGELVGRACAAGLAEGPLK